MKQMKAIAPLFSGWQETMIWSCLQGHMGVAAADDWKSPSSACITVGDFSFFAGRPCEKLVREAKGDILVPRETGWFSCLEAVLDRQIVKSCRYAIKKEPVVFSEEILKNCLDRISPEFSVVPIDRKLYDMVLAEEWSRDFCSQFTNFEDYFTRGLGFVAVYAGKPVAGASSYTVYTGGIEVEIDTKKDFRRKGLGKACGARLILECVKRGIYPSWDAIDLRSVRLAEQLGYHMDRPYVVYLRGKMLEER